MLSVDIPSNNMQQIQVVVFVLLFFYSSCQSCLSFLAEGEGSLASSALTGEIAVDINAPIYKLGHVCFACNDYVDLESSLAMPRRCRSV